VIAVEGEAIKYAFRSYAVALTEAESHRTQPEHEDAVIAKLFVVNFITAFTPLYYTAFAMARFEGHCESRRCMDDLFVAHDVPSCNDGYSLL
jgi:hypothetical protein